MRARVVQAVLLGLVACVGIAYAYEAWAEPDAARMGRTWPHVPHQQHQQQKAWELASCGGRGALPLLAALLVFRAPAAAPGWRLPVLAAALLGAWACLRTLARAAAWVAEAPAALSLATLHKAELAAAAGLPLPSLADAQVQPDQQEPGSRVCSLLASLPLALALFLVAQQPQQQQHGPAAAAAPPRARRRQSGGGALRLVAVLALGLVACLAGADAATSTCSAVQPVCTATPLPKPVDPPAPSTVAPQPQQQAPPMAPAPVQSAVQTPLQPPAAAGADASPTDALLAAMGASRPPKEGGYVAYATRFASTNQQGGTSRSSGGSSPTASRSSSSGGGAAVATVSNSSSSRSTLDGDIPQRVLPTSDQPQLSKAVQDALFSKLLTVLKEPPAPNETLPLPPAPSPLPGGAGNGTGGGAIVITRPPSPPPGPPTAVPGAGADGMLFLSNPRLRVGVDTRRGGSISLLSSAVMPPEWAGRNLVNTFDSGRLIQQSYYGCPDSSCWFTRPWRWNPVQGGSWQNSLPRLLESRATGGYVSVSAHPRNWGGQQLLEDVVMTSETQLLPDVVKVRFTMRYTGDAPHPPRHQEVPAVFVDRRLNVLAMYTGSKPWADEPLTFVMPGQAGQYYKPTERWAAYVDMRSGFGLGVYTPVATELVAYRIGPEGSNASSDCSYMAPIVTEQISSMTEFAYDTYFAAGRVDELRVWFKAIAATVQPNPAPQRRLALTDWSATSRLRLRAPEASGTTPSFAKALASDYQVFYSQPPHPKLPKASPIWLTKDPARPNAPVPPRPKLVPADAATPAPAPKPAPKPAPAAPAPKPEPAPAPAPKPQSAASPMPSLVPTPAAPTKGEVTIVFEPMAPAASPEQRPASQPSSAEPEVEPAGKPSVAQPAANPSAAKPKQQPAAEPSAAEPEQRPAAEPSTAEPEQQPAAEPSAAKPQQRPAAEPSAAEPEQQPAAEPSAAEPEQQPAAEPSAAEPDQQPAAEPSTAKPEQQPAAEPSAGKPEQRPAAEPSAAKPQQRPAAEPSTAEPEQQPAAEPSTAEPQQRPAAEPSTAEPEQQPAAEPSTAEPEQQPAAEPSTAKPEQRPAAEPSADEPKQQPAVEPSAAEPEQQPAAEPSTAKPEQQPAAEPSAAKPEQQPAAEPSTAKPEQQPAAEPSAAEPKQQPAVEPSAAEPEQQPLVVDTPRPVDEPAQQPQQPQQPQQLPGAAPVPAAEVAVPLPGGSLGITWGSISSGSDDVDAAAVDGDGYELPRRPSRRPRRHRQRRRRRHEGDQGAPYAFADEPVAVDVPGGGPADTQQQPAAAAAAEPAELAPPPALEIRGLAFLSHLLGMLGGR